jgi:hypothetical protein
MICMICEDKATGLHYGIITCEGWVVLHHLLTNELVDCLSVVVTTLQLTLFCVNNQVWAILQSCQVERQTLPPRFQSAAEVIFVS